MCRVDRVAGPVVLVLVAVFDSHSFDFIHHFRVLFVVPLVFVFVNSNSGRVVYPAGERICERESEWVRIEGLRRESLEELLR